MRSALVLVSLSLLSAPAFASSWELIKDEDGIKVWQRPVHGTSLVEFRGRGVVNADLKQILAVISDSDRKTEWMESCVENRILKTLEVGRRVVYNRTGSSFPLVSDRDVVVETQLSAWPEKRQITIEAWSTEDDTMPPVDGVVRMPKLLLKWKLVALSTQQTEVTYQVQADPGGSIPGWVVNLVAKNIPFNTLSNLRTQVKKDYRTIVARLDSAYDWSKVGL